MFSGVTSVAIKLAVHKLVARENLRRAEDGTSPLTQQEIARGSGVSQPVISTLLRRKATRLDLKTINGLCNFFQVQPGDLFEYSPDEEDLAS
jgi:putative transcriptional regulator